MQGRKVTWCPYCKVMIDTTNPDEHRGSPEHQKLGFSRFQKWELFESVKSETLNWLKTRFFYVLVVSVIIVSVVGYWGIDNLINNALIDARVEAKSIHQTILAMNSEVAKIKQANDRIDSLQNKIAIFQVVIKDSLDNLMEVRKRYLDNQIQLFSAKLENRLINIENRYQSTTADFNKLQNLIFRLVQESENLTQDSEQLRSNLVKEKQIQSQKRNEFEENTKYSIYLWAAVSDSINYELSVQLLDRLRQKGFLVTENISLQNEVSVKILKEVFYNDRAKTKINVINDICNELNIHNIIFRMNNKKIEEIQKLFSRPDISIFIRLSSN